MADAYPKTKQSSRGNHPRTSTLGGASAVPTPANNTGGGTGWGDKGFFKGGSQGTGHVAVSSPLSVYPNPQSINNRERKDTNKTDGTAPQRSSNLRRIPPPTRTKRRRNVQICTTRHGYEHGYIRGGLKHELSD